MRHTKLSFLALLLGASLLSSPALAKNPHGGHGHEKKHGHESHRSGPTYQDDRDVNLIFHFSDENRDYVRSYMRESYFRSCPPGLAKKHNGCLPPGQAKKYRVGGPLPEYAMPLPHELMTRLRPPATGTYYAMVDKDVVLVTEATKRILDAVTLLSAME